MLQKDTWKGRFSIQFHRTWKLLVLGYTRQILSTLLIKQVKRCWFKISDVWEKSNFRQSRSLIFPSYPIARVRWCYTRSELITVCNFHSVRWYFPWIENYGYGFGYGSDYVLRLQKASGISLVNLSSSFKHGWSKDGRIQWTETSFPDDVRRMKRMINNEDNDDE